MIQYSPKFDYSNLLQDSGEKGKNKERKSVSVTSVQRIEDDAKTWHVPLYLIYHMLMGINSF